ncbi:hypothetical protein [Haloarchaeobius sp. DFWS5]|uniref:hypothetical protein n=1 Tax=Haloarchaeobius sp. DFWS5 TaxID=3446114 RepID=UPI003EBB47EF
MDCAICCFEIEGDQPFVEVTFDFLNSDVSESDTYQVHESCAQFLRKGLRE